LNINAARFLVDYEMLRLSTLGVDNQIKLRIKSDEFDKKRRNNCNLSSLKVQLQLNLKIWKKTILA
jgi:hypothetical protein